MKRLSLVLVAVLLTACTKVNTVQTPTASPILDVYAIKQTDSVLWYTKEGKVYTYNLQTQKEIMNTDLSFNDTENLFFSNDGTYLYFTFNKITEKTNVSSIPYPNLMLGVYNTKTKNIQESPAEIGAGVISMSPKGNYIVYDVGCCPGNRGREIYTKEGKKVDSLNGTDFAWSPKDLFAFSKGTVTIRLPTGPEPQNQSLYIYNPTTNTTELLLKATYQDSYVPMEWQDEDHLIYKQNHYSKPLIISEPQEYSEEYYKPWLEIFENPEESYWKINRRTKIKEKVKYSEKKSLYTTSEEYQLEQSPSGELIMAWNMKENKLKIRVKKTLQEIKTINLPRDTVWQPKVQ